jgi:outer membrane protein assembly factor BamB
VVAHGTVYVGSSNGRVRAFDLRSGREKCWRQLAGSVDVLDLAGAVRERHDVDRPVVHAPAGDDGRVVFTTGQTGDHTPRRSWLHIGDTVHRVNGYPRPPVVAHGDVAVANEFGKLRVYRASRPEEPLWTRQLIGDAQFVIRGDSLLTNEAGVIAYDLESGRKRWRAGPLHASFADSHDRERVVLLDRVNSSLAVIDVRDGAVVADFDLPTAPLGADLRDGLLAWSSGFDDITTAVLTTERPS